jgi:hypothetical protein
MNIKSLINNLKAQFVKLIERMASTSETANRHDDEWWRYNGGYPE